MIEWFKNKVISFFKNLFPFLFEDKEKKEIHYRKTYFKENTPKNDLIKSGEFIVVMHKGNQLWTLFKCPCGCGEVITLSLKENHQPHWKFYQSENKRPSLHPSVWRTKGCKSHFWLKDGIVTWCGNSGPH